MKINSIKIENLGVYVDAEINLDSSKTNLAFINGYNGRGKTTLIDSLKWCLFAGSMPPVSKFAIANKPSDGRIRVLVEIEIQESPGRSFVVERSQWMTVMDDGTTHGIGQPETVGLLREFGQPSREENDIRGLLQRRFPKRLENFILFDAEQLANFFTPTTKIAIRDAVLELAGVETLDVVIQGVENHVKRIRSQLAKTGGGDGESIQAAIDALEVEIGAMKDDQNADDEALAIAKEELALARRELAKFDIARENLGKLDSLRNEQTSLLADLKREEADFQNQLIRNSYLFVLGDCLKGVGAFYQAGVDAGYPRAFPTESLREILAKGNCLCGCSLTQTGHKDAIQRLIEAQSKAEGIDKTLPDTQSAAAQMLSTITAVKATLLGKNRLISALSKQIADNEVAQEELDSGAASSNQWADAEARERRLTARVNSLTVTLTNRRGDIDAKLAKLRSLQVELNKLIQETETTRLLSSRLAFAEGCLDSSRLARSMAIELVRESLETSMNRHYGNIKAGTFKVQITDSFEIQLKNADSQSISEGERMSLAYSFAIALRESLQMKLPLVVDSAFGKLDSRNRQWLTDALVALVREDKDRQAIFLMHDLEYTPLTRETFSAANPLELYLSHDESSQVTRVLSGIDPEWLSSKEWQVR